MPQLLQKYIIPDSSRLSYLAVLRNISWYHLLAIFFGTSIFGVVLLPLLSSLRGYLLSLTAATIITNVAGNGVLLAFIYVGLSSILSIPCLFVLSMDSFALSKKLCLLESGTYKQAASLMFLRHAIVCFIFLTASAALEIYISPLFIGLII